MGMKHKVRKHARRATPRKGRAATSVTLTDSSGKTTTLSDEQALKTMAEFIEGSPDDGMVLSPLNPGQGTDDDEVLGDIDTASHLETEYNSEGD